MQKYLQALLTIVILGLATTPVADGGQQAPPATRRALAVIVNPKNPVTNLSFNELRAYLRLTRQKWKEDNKPIELLLRPSSSVEMQILLDKVYRMTSAQLHKYWAGKVFRGDITSKPSVVPTAAAARKRVLKVRSALTVVMYDQVPADVRILTIDGKKPTDEGYRLTLDDGEEASRP